jgi:arginine/lysine/ornithine decarboxylase
MPVLDDRRESQGVLTDAQELMAAAVDADRAFFSTCGSSLSVKSAMISVAGPGEKLLVSHNAHTSVIAGVVIAGIEPVWVHPHFDDQAVGRIAAEMVSPYPPGVPVLAPGERINADVPGYLTSGTGVGMLIPDAADASMRTHPVVAE